MAALHSPFFSKDDHHFLPLRTTLSHFVYLPCSTYCRVTMGLLDFLSWETEASKLRAAKDALPPVSPLKAPASEKVKKTAVKVSSGL